MGLRAPRGSADIHPRPWFSAPIVVALLSAVALSGAPTSSRTLRGHRGSSRHDRHTVTPGSSLPWLYDLAWYRSWPSSGGRGRRRFRFRRGSGPAARELLASARLCRSGSPAAPSDCSPSRSASFRISSRSSRFRFAPLALITCATRSATPRTREGRDRLYAGILGIVTLVCVGPAAERGLAVRPEETLMRALAHSEPLSVSPSAQKRRHPPWHHSRR